METCLLRGSGALWVIRQYPPYLGPLGSSRVFGEMIPQKEQIHAEAEQRVTARRDEDAQTREDESCG